MVEAKNLVKKYGANTALKGISFSLEPGKIYGFLGPNGAGKSTTMNIITGCLSPTEGEVYVCGVDMLKNPIAAKRHIGYLSETPHLYPEMTPREYLIFVGEAKGLRGSELYDGVRSVMDMTGITDVKDRLIRNLSKGYRQRVGISQAILGDPDIVILDEPTVGLDPIQIIGIRKLIRDLGQDRTVILSSHILTEISEICDHIIIISEGEIIAGDTVENLKSLAEGSVYVDLEVRGEIDDVMDALDSFGDIRSFEVRETDEDGVFYARLEMDRDVDLRENIFFLFAERRLPIISMEYEKITLEKIFLDLLEEKRRERAAMDEGADPDSDGADGASDSGYAPLFG